jgi:hypothetical protein
LSLSYRRGLYLAIILIYVCIGAISGAYVTLNNRPKVLGFVFFPWDITYTIDYVDVINSSPFLVVSHAGNTYIFNEDKWFKVNVDVNSACISEKKIILAGQLNGSPLLMIIKDGKGILYLFNVTGSLMSVKCKGSLVVAGGTLPRPFILIYNISSFTAKAYILSEEVPAIKISLDVRNDCVAGLVKLINGSTILFRLDLNRPAKLNLYSLNLDFEEVRVEGVTCSKEGPLLYGSFIKGNSTLGFLYLLTQNKLIILRPSGFKGIRVLMARELESKLIRMYLRPVGDFWDGIGELDYRKSRVWFSRLFWPYNHVVLTYNVNWRGNITTATVLYTESGNLLVIAKGFSLMPAVLWYRGAPLFYIKKPVIGENLKVSITTCHTRLKLLGTAKVLDVNVISTRASISPYFNEIRPRKLSLGVNKSLVYALNILFSIIIGAVIYEAFRPRV